MPAKLEHDNTMLLDVLEETTLQSLMNAFAEANFVAVAIYTPDGRRVGDPSHYSGYCDLIRSSPDGLAACQESVRQHMPVDSEPVQPYTCHACLRDFAVPIVAERDGQSVLIGGMFAGQLRMNESIARSDISEVADLAERFRLDLHGLFAAYTATRHFPSPRVDRIQRLMKALADTVGQMATRRYVQHRFMQKLPTMSTADEVVIAITQFMHAAACSVFMENPGEPGRIYLRATSYGPLKTDVDRVFYEPGQGLTGWVYQHGRPLNIRNVHDKRELAEQSPPVRWKSKVWDVGETESVRAFIGVPIKSEDGRTVGVIRAVRTSGSEFLTMQQEAFEAIAATASLVTERLREAARDSALLEVSQQVLSNVELSQVVGSVIEQAMRLYSPRADNVWVTTYSPWKHEFQIMACHQRSISHEQYLGQTFPETRGIAGYMLKNPLPFRSDDLSREGIESVVPSVRSCIAYPLVVAQEFLGVVVVASGGRNAFTARDLETLKLLGMPVTQAFLNAQRFEDALLEGERRRSYLQCLDMLNSLTPPFSVRGVVDRIADVLMQQVGFDSIAEFVSDAEGVLRCTRVLPVDGDQRTCHELIGEPYEGNGDEVSDLSMALHIAAPPGQGGAVLLLRRDDRSNPITEFDQRCLRLAAGIVSSHLHTERQLATVIETSIVASSHDIGKLVVTPRDVLDTIVNATHDASLPDVVHRRLAYCLRQLNHALEWAQTSMLLTDYRRGVVPDATTFATFDFKSALDDAIEPETARANWQIHNEVSADTRVYLHAEGEGFRRIMRDLMSNAREHGWPKGLREVRATNTEICGTQLVRLSIANESDTVSAERAHELSAMFESPEKMALGFEYGVGIMLAAVIAKIHDGVLTASVEGSVVTFSFTVPVARSDL